ncbi:unnamed protein product [Soboliphyme baturini]|uniref:Leucine-rich repeat-containing protein 15-like n=1 Tax=Soboliphyme baturini TaxID=241478 RepID=A0A183IEG9_9BILA|nr:unnamed protein product [Soboliphyme baturini]
MKLPCYVEIKSSSGGQGRPAQAILALKNNNKNEVQLVVYFANKPFKFYDVKKLHTVFERFVIGGKAGLYFESLGTYLFISKADPVALKKLLSVLKSIITGRHVAIEDLSSSRLSVKRKDFENLRKSMIITSRAEYPFDSSLPPYLELFQANFCRLSRFDNRILNLSQLRFLDLSNNSLGHDLSCIKFGQLENLRELKLADNRILSLPESFFTSLPRGLINLCLSNNLLTTVHPSLFSISLVHLDLSRNLISALPEEIVKVRYSLRYLNVANNLLTRFHFGIFHLNAVYIDIVGNPFDTSKILDESDHFLPSLLHYTAKAVKDAKLVLPFLPPRCRDALNDCPVCDVCGKACVPGTMTKLYGSRRLACYVTFNLPDGLTYGGGAAWRGSYGSCSELLTVYGGVPIGSSIFPYSSLAPKMMPLDHGRLADQFPRSESCRKFLIFLVNRFFGSS